MRLRPLRDQVIVQRDVPDEAVGAIYIPEAHRDWRATNGTALAIGSQVHTVKVGDRVLLPLYGGVEVTHDGVLLALVPEDDILGVFAHASA